MLSRAWVVALLLSPFALDVVPQCTPAPVYSGAFRTTVLDISIDGNDLWAATSYGVALYDRRVDPPQFIASTPVAGTTRVVRAQSGFAYLGSGMNIVVAARIGNRIEIARSVTTGATVNDLLIAPPYLYAATTNGLMQFDLLDPTNPRRTAASFETSSANTTTLAFLSNTLFVTDGDSTVESFLLTVPTLPQKTATLASLPRSISVEATGNRIYVSDALNTDIFLTTALGATKIATIPFAATSLIAQPGDLVFAAGNDRRIHALDLSVPGSPVELFEAELVPSGGTVNRITQILAATNRIYAAAGDLGIAVYDTSRFKSPFPIRSYVTDPPTSVMGTGGRIYISRPVPPGGIQEYNIGSSGTLTPQRQWESRGMLLHDSGNGLLLTSSGNTLTLWTLASTLPVAISTATFREPVVAAILIGSTAYAVLDKQTLWAADMSQVSPAPRQIALTGISPSYISRSSAAIAIGQVREDAMTLIQLHNTNGTFLTPLQSVTIPGAITSPIAMSATQAAVFAFQGVTLIDLATGATAVIPQSNTALVRQLAFHNDSLVGVTDTGVRVWNARTRTLDREVALPASPSGVVTTSEGIAAIRTTAGLIAYDLRTTSTQPEPLPSITGNAYYRKIAAGGGRLYLFSAQGVDIYDTSRTTAPEYVGGIRGSFIDIAVSADRLFTLTSSGTLTAYTSDGARLQERTISYEAADSRPLTLHVVNGAPWISFSGGSLGGANRTLVVGSATLVRTSDFAGSIVDVVTDGTRAFALSELPKSLLHVDVSDPLHPVIRNTRDAEGAPGPVSIAYSAGRVVTVGEKLYIYDEALTKIGEQLSSYQPDPNGGVSFVDQRLRSIGSCLLLTGRTFAAQTFTVPALTAGTAPAFPSGARSVVVDGNKSWILTEHSLELWTLGTITTPPLRRKTAR